MDVCVCTTLTVTRLSHCPFFLTSTYRLDEEPDELIKQRSRSRAMLNLIGIRHSQCQAPSSSNTNSINTKTNKTKISPPKDAAVGFKYDPPSHSAAAPSNSTAADCVASAYVAGNKYRPDLPTICLVVEVMGAPPKTSRQSRIS